MSDILERLKAALSDRYAVERELGAGGMATVYLAEDLKHRRQVAIKVLKSDLAIVLGRERFLREIEIAARLRHPHILPLYESGEADGFLFYVMPYARGESLGDRIKREKQLPLEDAIRYARDVADALSYAHGEGVVHRDIKPDNIMIESGHAVVMDFGIARAIGAAGAHQLTATGVTIGTVYYMSPEQAAGEWDLDGRSDVYSLGCVLYEMLSGKPPFTGPTAESVRRQHLEAPVPPVTLIRGSVPQSVVDIIDTAMAKTPADRYSRAETFVDDLGRSAVRDVPVSSRHRRPTLRGLVVVGAVLLAAGYALMTRNPAGSVRGVPMQRQVTFTGNVFEASVSPQGDFLVYTTTGPDSSMLWVHDLESSSTIQIGSSPEPFRAPNWSPDGREIVVGTEPRSAYRHVVYPRLGGEPYAIRGFGAVVRWSVDTTRFYSWAVQWHDVWLYASESDSPVRVEIADSSAWVDDVAQHPSGNVFAILQGRRGRSGSSIWRMELDREQQFRSPSSDSDAIEPARYELLVENEAMLLSVEWSPDGDALYYLREDQGVYQLWKLRTSSDGFARGNPELLASGLELVGWGPNGRPEHWDQVASISADGSDFYYVKGRTFSNLWSLRSRAGSWVAEPLTTGTATNDAPSASPDGQWVAYRSNVGGRTNIFVMPSQGGPSRQLTRVDSVSGDPVWSPDGESIAFGLRRGDRSVVATVGITGTGLNVFEATELSDNGTIVWGPGTDILYLNPSNTNFHFLDPATGDERPLLRPEDAALGFVLVVRYSPDGTQMAVLWNRSPTLGIYVISLLDGGQRRLAVDPGVAPLGWAPDGRTLFALSADGRSVLRVPADGGAPTVLDSLPFVASPFGGTAYDGDWFVFVVPGVDGDVWRIEDFDPGR